MVFQVCWRQNPPGDTEAHLQVPQLLQTPDSDGVFIWKKNSAMLSTLRAYFVAYCDGLEGGARYEASQSFDPRPEMVVFCLGIEALWQFQLHSVYIPKMGFIEKFMNTHTMHQAHHAQNLEYLDKNHGGFLNIFDKLFGSWIELDDKIQVKYGVVHAPNSHNPLVILTHEFRDIWHDVTTKARNPWHAFMYIFGPPGWSHDGSTMTVRQMQRRWKTSEEMMAELAAKEGVAVEETQLVLERVH